MGLCEALAFATERIPFGTSIANIYVRHAADYAQTASLIHELSGGRFRFGVGVSHGPALERLGVKAGPPLGDIRTFVAAIHANTRAGEPPPIVLATLRKRMISLAGEIAQGMVFANGARSHMRESLAALPPTRANDPAFFVGNMIPTCISDDIAAAAATNRRTLIGYVSMPNYRNYWREAGYVEEMNAIEAAVVAKDFERIPSLMSERWLSDVTLYGPATRVREGLEAWYDAGIRTPILVPSSAAGNQMKAFEELFSCRS